MIQTQKKVKTSTTLKFNRNSTQNAHVFTFSPPNLPINIYLSQTAVDLYALGCSSQIRFLPQVGPEVSREAGPRSVLKESTSRNINQFSANQGSSMKRGTRGGN